MKRAWLFATLITSLIGADALADPDGAFGLGAGAADVTAPAGSSQLNTVFTVLTADVTGGVTATITVHDATGFANGDLIMLWEPAGASVDSGIATSIEIAGAQTGTRELARISGTISGNSIPVTASASASLPLLQDFSAAKHVQVLKVPEFHNYTIPNTAIVSTLPWTTSSNGGRTPFTGGIVAFLATGTVSIDGTLTATGAGFNGGAPTFNWNGAASCGDADVTPANSSTGEGQPRGEGLAGTSDKTNGTSLGFGNIANGGGSGNCVQNGGGGGGNGGPGGSGGGGNDGAGSATTADRGNPGAGVKYSDISLSSQMTMGGGGGAGGQNAGDATAGLNGGGVVWFRAAALTTPGHSGNISADGQSTPGAGPNDGQGGGGGGGTIYVRIVGTNDFCQNGLITANGSDGIDAPTNPSPSPVGAGGGGGGGQVLIQDASGGCKLGSNVTADPGSHGAKGPKGGSLSTDGTQGDNETPPSAGYCSTDGTPTTCPGAIPVCDTIHNTCVECVGNSDCPADAPVCSGNTCHATCDTTGGFNCATNHPSQPNCDSDNAQGKKGQCVQCLSSTDCPNSAPVCDSSNSASGDTCTGCTSGADCSSRSGATQCHNPGASGQCVECIADANCPVSQPACDTVTTFTCGNCTGNGNCNGVTHTGPSPSPVSLCDTTVSDTKHGACVSCLGNNDCSNPTPQCDTTGKFCEGCSDNNGCTKNAGTPLCAAPNCVQCIADSDCPVASPRCSGNVCVACNSNTNCNGVTHIGPSPSPVLLCDTNSDSNQGACVGCLDNTNCSNPKPQCDTSGNFCEGCSANAGCVGHGGTPECVSSQCVQCIGANQATECDATHPICNSNACSLCSSTGDDGACQAKATGGALPFCDTFSAGVDPTLHGQCVGCRDSTQCPHGGTAPNPSPAGPTPICRVGIRSCVACIASDNAACAAAHSGTTVCDVTPTPSPNPDPFAGYCVGCESEADCTPTHPVCYGLAPSPAPDTRSCGPCNDDGDCALYKRSDGVAFLCDTGTGKCVGCTTNADCTRAAPFCNTGTCEACDIGRGNSDCSLYADTPTCQPAGTANAGKCGQCNVENTTLCTTGSGEPACNFDNGNCQLCTVSNHDMGAVSVGCAANPSGHACEGDDTTVFCGCSTDADCGSSTSGRICDPNTSRCIDGCSRSVSRNNCPSGEFCTSDDTTGDLPGICTMTCNFNVDCTGAMPAMPFCINALGDGGIPDGSTFGVSADGGVGRCAGCRDDGDCGGTTPVCEPSKKICVQCTATRLDQCTAAAMGAACLTDETCGCQQDSDCGATDSGRICDLTGNHQCKPGCRVLGGNGCPSGFICNGAGLVPGECVTPNDLAMNIPDAGSENVDMSIPMDMTQTGFKLRGGGFGCDVGGGEESTSLATLLLLSLALAWVRLRLRRRAR